MTDREDLIHIIDHLASRVKALEARLTNEITDRLEYQKLIARDLGSTEDRLKTLETTLSLIVSPHTTDPPPNTSAASLGSTIYTWLQSNPGYGSETLQWVQLNGKPTLISIQLKA